MANKPNKQPVDYSGKDTVKKARYQQGKSTDKGKTPLENISGYVLNENKGNMNEQKNSS